MINAFPRRYVPVPEAPQGESVYSQWYKQTYPDTVVGLAATSNEGLVSVDNAGTVRLWETGVANLQARRHLLSRILKITFKIKMDISSHFSSSNWIK